MGQLLEEISWSSLRTRRRRVKQTRFSRLPVMVEEINYVKDNYPGNTYFKG